MPEFNAGAMENPGCVVLRDQYLFRGAATHQQVLGRSSTIAHEMAHMWFGDLVTMRWWDDLWLNESFAEYMAYRTLVEATEFTDAWVEFAMVRKLWGYAAERAPSTHPVAGAPAPDALTALSPSTASPTPRARPSSVSSSRTSVTRRSSRGSRHTCAGMRTATGSWPSSSRRWSPRRAWTSVPGRRGGC